MAIRQWSDRVTWQQTSRTRAAAALLIISTFVPGQQPARWAQAQQFGPTESFVQPQVARPLLIRGTAASATALRLQQAKVFGNVESFAQTQRPSSVVLNGTFSITQDIRRKQQAVRLFQQSIAIQFPVNRILDPTAASYNPATDIAREGQAQAFSQPETFARSAASAALIINGSAAAISADLLIGFDSVGWPADQSIWTPARLGSLPVVLTTYTPYSSATAIRGKQAQFFGAPEAFVQPASIEMLLLNGAMAGATALRQPQAKFFSYAESFIQVQRQATLILNGSASYLFGIDAQRRQQAKVFAQPEFFDQAQHGAALVRSGTIAGWNAIPLGQVRWFTGPEEFLQPLQPALLVINGVVTPYNPAVDPRRARAQVFAECETFVASWNASRLVIAPTPIIDAPRGASAKVFGNPERFEIAWRANLLILNGTEPLIPPEATMVVAAIDNFTITVSSDVQLLIIPTGS